MAEECVEVISGLTDSTGFTVTRWRGTSPVLMNWCRTPPGTRTASPALIGYSLPPHTRMPAPSVINAWCSHWCTWSGLDSPGPCFTYSITNDETPSSGPSRGLVFPCSLRITGSTRSSSSLLAEMIAVPGYCSRVESDARKNTPSGRCSTALFTSPELQFAPAIGDWWLVPDASEFCP